MLRSPRMIMYILSIIVSLISNNLFFSVPLWRILSDPPCPIDSHCICYLFTVP